VIVCVLVLVLVLILVLVLVLGSVVAVVGDGVVVLGGVVGVLVSVTVLVGAGTTLADVVVGVVVVVVVVLSGEPEAILTSTYTTSAMRRAPIAPNATRAAGVRYQGTGSSGGGPGG
jgi:hypothetical protein